MTPPTSYSEWRALMDEISGAPRNDDYIQVVRLGTVSWTSGVAERFIQTVSNTIRNRMNVAQDVYKRQIKNSKGGDMAVANALSVLTKEYRYLYQLSAALPIPSEYVEQMKGFIQNQADQTHDSLINSAKADRTGKLASIVRSAGVNKLTVGG